MTGRLAGKVAVITGGCSGMGRGTVELFVAEGASVVVADIQDDLGAELEDKYGDALRYAHCDIVSEGDLKATMQAAVDAFGGLDIVFNNAASSGSGAFIEDLTVDDWAASDNLILRSVMLGCKHAVPHMKRRGGGSIINTASGTAVMPFSKQRGPAYGTMKAAVVHLTKYLAAELGPQRIRANAIVPGYITTSIQGISIGATRQTADLMVKYYDSAFAALQPIPVAGKPEHIAEAVLFLGSDSSVWVTGAVLPVDGGLLVKYQADDSVPAALHEAKRLAEDELAAR